MSNLQFLGWIKNFKKRFGIDKLAGDRPNESRKKKSSNIISSECETIEYLIETNADSDSSPQYTYTVKPKLEFITEEQVNDAEAYRCLETVIKWSMQRQIDTLYLTMLRNLKARARKGNK